MNTPSLKPTKRGVVAALRHLGFFKNPPSLFRVKPASSFSSEELSWAHYIIADTDFGGCWNDASQVNLHLA